MGVNDFHAMSPTDRDAEIKQLEQMLAEPQPRDDSIPTWVFQFAVILFTIVGIESLVAVAYAPVMWLPYLATSAGSAVVVFLAVRFGLRVR